MINRMTILLFLMMSVLLIGCSGNTDTSNKTTKQNQSNDTEKTTLTISAAVSLTDALEEVKEMYEQENPVELTFNLGGSGTLAQQVKQGAPSDLFISANQQWMDTLEDEDLIDAKTRTNLTGNNLVLITGSTSTISYQSFEEISSGDVDKIAIGNPESVPAGKYTENTLHSLNMWDELEDQLVFAKNVRQVLTYVESGNTEIGFVYESDALNSDKVKILATAEEGLHDPIIYPMAVVADTKNKQEAMDFAAFLETEEAQEVLISYGFRK